MIVNTTNFIERNEISRYNISIASNIVIGKNTFSQIVASYLVFFGSRITSYEKKKTKMNKRVIKIPNQHTQLPA